MDMDSLSESVKEMIYRMASDKNIEITETSNLYHAGVMDSLNIIILLSQLQSELSVNIQEEALAPENFESVKAVCNFVSAAIFK